MVGLRVRLFRADDTRSASERARALSGQAAALRRLGLKVSLFYVRALVRAHREHDVWSLDVATRPRELAELLAIARGRTRIAEIGTGTAWTTTALVVDDPERTVLSCDVVARPQRERYLALAGSAGRARITLLEQGGEAGPPAGAGPFDLLFIDSSHERDETMATFSAWSAVLAPGAAVAFHDFGDPAYPGVEEAVRDLGLGGRREGRMWIYESAGSAGSATLIDAASARADVEVTGQPGAVVGDRGEPAHHDEVDLRLGERPQ